MVWSRAISGSSHARAVSHIDVTHAGEVYRVKLRSTRTVRRLTLRVSHSSGDVVLTTPNRLALNSAIEFAQRHAAWIGARLRRLPEPVPFIPGEIIPIRGLEHRIVHASDRRGTVWIEALETTEIGSPVAALFVAGDSPHLSRRIVDYLKRNAKQDLEAAVERYCALLKIPARSVTVRDTSSRWGSCSASGTLNFSWRLILAPTFVLDYLAAHEVAHLVHMNHSTTFWTLTRKLCADTDRAEAWLNSHGPSLYKYGKRRAEN